MTSVTQRSQTDRIGTLLEDLDDLETAIDTAAEQSEHCRNYLDEYLGSIEEAQALLQRIKTGIDLL